MTGEMDVVTAIMARLEALLIACDEDESALGRTPTSLGEFQAMGASRRIASRALLKTVEQLEDQLARLFRILPKLKLADTAGWHTQDYANFAEKLGILEDSFAWTEIVKLRNRLVHDYPLDPSAQLDTLAKARDATGLLRSSVVAAREYLVNEGLIR